METKLSGKPTHDGAERGTERDQQPKRQGLEHTQ